MPRSADGSIRLMLLRTRYEHWSAHASMNRFSTSLDPGVIAVTERLVSNGDDDFPVTNPRLRRIVRGALLRRRDRHYHLSDLVAEGSVLRRSIQRRMDIVHFLDGEHTARFSPPLLRWIPGVRAVATFHQPPEFLDRLVNRRAVAALDVVTLVAPHQAEWFDPILGADRVRTILLSTDTSFFRPKPRSPDGIFRCVSCGHWLRDWTAMGAVARALSDQPDIEFHVVTDRPTGLDGMSNVSIHRHLSDTDLCALYQASDVLFLPLTSGTANNTILEAIACGLPVVTSDIPGTRTYLSGGEGILVERGATDATVEELADALLRLRASARDRVAMGKRARARAEALAWPRMAPAYEALYRELGPARTNRGGRPHRRQVRISIVIPSHDAATTLPATVASLGAQRYAHWEAVIVDDGSTDRTFAVATALAEQDARVRVVRRPDRGGASRARNDGLAASAAEWVLFLDADDVLLPGHLERLAAELRADDGLDGAYSGWCRLAANDELAGTYVPPPPAQLADALRQHCPLQLGGLVVRRSLVLKAGGFDPDYPACNDWDFLLRLSRTGARLARVPEILVGYRMRPGSISNDGEVVLRCGLRLIAAASDHDGAPPTSDDETERGDSPAVGAIDRARLRLACWAAGLAIGAGRDAGFALDAVSDRRAPDLTAEEAAWAVYMALPSPTGRTPERLREIWSDAAPRARAFFATLAERSGAAGLSSAAPELERLVTEAPLPSVDMDAAARDPREAVEPPEGVPLLGMTTPSEQEYFLAYARDEYRGRGEIVDLGCWLGSTTIPLAKGLEKNSRRESAGKRVHAFDIFIWEEWMEPFVRGAPVEGRFVAGDSFRSEFERRIAPVASRVSVHCEDLRTYRWRAGGIEFLLVDAMKSWELANGILGNFFPALIPGESRVAQQDFAHYYTPWIHLLTYRFRKALRADRDVPHGPTMVFRYVEPIPDHDLRRTYSFADFNDEEVDAAFEHSLGIAHAEKHDNIIAAKAMTFVHQERMADAARVLEAYRPKGAVRGELAVVRSMVAAALDPHRQGNG